MDGIILTEWSGQAPLLTRLSRQENKGRLKKKKHWVTHDLYLSVVTLTLLTFLQVGNGVAELLFSTCSFRDCSYKKNK